MIHHHSSTISLMLLFPEANSDTFEDRSQRARGPPHDQSSQPVGASEVDCPEDSAQSEHAESVKMEGWFTKDQGQIPSWTPSE